MKYDFDLNVDTENSLSLIVRNIKEKSVVLEFGPANGRLTKYLNKEMECKVYLVEIDEEAGRDAAAYGEDIIIEDIESYGWEKKYKDIVFDYIVCADVLEHLRNPLQVLVRAKKLLKEDGKILLSVPNLAHNSVLIDLHNDKFNYTNIGLLDNTHIHFFTKESLDKMISDAGLFCEKKMSTNASVGTIEIDNSVTQVSGIAPGYWNARKNGEVYQYVYVLSKSECDTLDEINMYTDHYYFQYYFGETSGEWDEKKSFKMPIDINIQKGEYEIDVKGENGYIRLDPINCNCIIEIDELYCVADGKRQDLEMAEANFRKRWDKQYFFKTQDPIFIYKIPEKAEKIVFKCSYMIFDMGVSSRIESVLERQCEVTDNIETSLRQERDSLQNQLNILWDKQVELDKQYVYEKHRADILQEQRERLESKKLYKIYKFFRRK